MLSVLMSLGLPARGAGYFEDGFELLQLCQAEQRLDQERASAAMDVSKCMGYIEGVMDGLSLARNPTIVCMPNIHLGQESRDRFSCRAP